MNPLILSQNFPILSILSQVHGGFFPGFGKEVGQNWERIIPLVFNGLSSIYIFFLLFHKNKEH
jgi:hypothetical protein